MNEAVHFVDVAVSLPIDGPFTYRVPPHLIPLVEIGRRVFVPFRNKIRTGFIVDASGTAPDCSPESIRDVADISDEKPYLSLELWRFITWVADYYLLPNGLVLKAALPPGTDRQSKPWAILTPEALFQLEAQRENADEHLPLKLLRNAFMPLQDLERTVGRESVEQMVNTGWLRIEERLARPRIRLRNKKLPELLYPAGTASPATPSPHLLTSDQDAAVKAILHAVDRGGFHPFLLFGVTGSGKTEVYLRTIEDALRRGKQALVLVPEIALTPQLARRFLRRLGGGVALFHSGLTPSQRHDEWRRIRLGEVSVVIGARSGIFVPLERLAVIVVDEEHDSSYKQEDRCPYHARDMALARAKLQNATVVLGSATPSFETFVNAQRGKITRLDLPTRHHGGKLPVVELIDLKTAKSKGGQGAFLTVPLVAAMEEALNKKEQVVLFLNRRGHDTFAQCKLCAYVFKCPNCDISLTHHKKERTLRCHVCGFARSSPPLCPQCSGEKLFFGGVGTQKVEERLASLFPQARVERLDRDSTRRRQELESILDRFRNKEIDILTGTQMIVKGHDFPGISLVGVLCGDQSLHFPDFRAAERTFQMLTQVAGRTGRETDSGRVILQTFDPEQMAIRLAANHAFEAFFEHDSIMRQELAYPPYGHLILVRIEGNSEKRVEKRALQIGRAARLAKEQYRDVMILGPAPSPRRKVVGRFRWQVLFKSGSRGPVRNLVKALLAEGHLKAHGLKITVDVDPFDLM